MRIVCLSVLLVASGSAVLADDWPQWMGPGRDNVWSEDGILEEFPAGGPQIVWRTPIAGGYAGPAVAGGRVYVTDYVTEDNVKIDNFDREEFTGIERVLCLDQSTGEIDWQHEYPVRYTMSYPAGPRCTPNVSNGHVYTLGGEGHLHCFNAETGAVVWSKNLPQDYDTKTAMWGYASHPLIDGDKLICVAGGAGSHAVAFDKNSGEEIWRALSAQGQGYSPPTIIEAGGVRQLILLRPGAISAVNPDTGEEYWSVPYEASSGSVIMSPVFSDGLLYAGGFSNKNLLLSLSADHPSAAVEWRDLKKKGISPVNVQPFAEEGTLYGFDQNGSLYAVNLATGDRLWETNEPLRSQRRVRSGTAFIVRQADRFWLFTERGELIIARLSTGGYQELDSAQVIETSNAAFGRDVVWSVPAYANRRAYIRNDEEIICVNLAAGQ